jgi:hypothetical protein
MCCVVNHAAVAEMNNGENGRLASHFKTEHVLNIKCWHKFANDVFTTERVVDLGPRRDLEQQALLGWVVTIAASIRLLRENEPVAGGNPSSTARRPGTAQDDGRPVLAVINELGPCKSPRG